MSQPILLMAYHGQEVPRTPIWLMRQAGRYLPEYRSLRVKYNIVDIINNPELATLVTLQPIKRFDLDAAIIFSDILPPLAGMGLNLAFTKGSSPRILNPISNSADVDALRITDPNEHMKATLQAIQIVRQELASKIALIGFAGAPFTLATYAIEGTTSRQFSKTKRLMFEQPIIWHSLMSKLSKVVQSYLIAQANAGAQALQLFDSWVGILAKSDYQEYVLPYIKQIFSGLKKTGVPLIYFSTGTAHMLDVLSEIECDVLSLDWRIDLAKAKNVLPKSFAIQGNLEPNLLFAPFNILKKRALAILDAVGTEPGFVFNLGHGILPNTPIEAVANLCRVVHDFPLKRADHL